MPLLENGAFRSSDFCKAAIESHKHYISLYQCSDAPQGVIDKLCEFEQSKIYEYEWALKNG